MMDPKQLLQWHIEAGVDETIGDEAVDYFKGQEPQINIQEEKSTPNPQSPIPNPPALHHTPSAALAQSREQARAAQDLAALEAAVRAFDGCALKKSASKTVFADGNPKARVMIIGEAPGAQEDLQGIPFCGPSGQLLDRMFASIGLTRAENLYISNTVFWRPPGNRQPTPEETSVCLPFVEKHIALVNPALLILSGGTATTTLLKKDTSISRLRGKIYEYSNEFLSTPIRAMVTFHPSYLLRSPAQKRLAWDDMLQAKAFLQATN